MTEPTEQELAAARQILNNPISTFAPTRPQQDFLNLGSFIQVFSGANWCGKTCIGAAKLTACIFGTKNEFFNTPFFHRFPSRCRFRIISTHTAIEHAIIPEIKKWFPKGRYTTSKGSRMFESKIVCDTGATGDLMTLDQDLKEFESVKLDLAWFDEPPPYKVFAATVARMRPNGVIIFTMTPLSDAGWLFDKVNNPWAEKSWSIIYADIESACKQHGKNGYMEHEEIQKKIAEYDEEEKEARISGRPIHLSGLIYKTWNRKIHVVKPFEIPSDWTRYCIVDPHDRKPYAIMWAAVSPDEKVYIYDESPNQPFHTMKTSTMTVTDYAKLIRAKEDNQKIFGRIIDARFGKKSSSQTGRSIRDMFDDERLYFQDSYLDYGGSIEQGHQAVKEYLKPGVDGRPGLMVFSNCYNVIYSFEHYIWDDYRKDDRAPKEKPKDSHKDFMDTTRYLVMEGPRYVQETGAPESQPKWAQGASFGYGNDGP